MKCKSKKHKFDLPPQYEGRLFCICGEYAVWVEDWWPSSYTPAAEVSQQRVADALEVLHHTL